MGLDFVEIIMSVEEQFDVSIKDQDASQVKTVGDLVDLVQRDVNTAIKQPSDDEPPVCRTSRAFYRLRRELLELLPISRRDVRPAARLGELVPRNIRREAWYRLRARNMSLPPLTFSRATAAAILGLACLPVVLLSFWVGNPWPLILFLPLAFVAVRVAEPLRWGVPASCARVADAARLLSLRPPIVGEIPSRAEIAERIQHIVADTLGIPLERVTERAHLIEDLGCG